MRQRFLQLDGVRAVAILLVMMHHYGVMAGLFPGSAWVWPLGSRLFFVLSGFLITGILWDCRPAAQSGKLGRLLGHFLMRRVLRLVPLYFTYLSLLVLVSPWVRANWLWFISFTQNQLFFFEGEAHGGGHLWSLAVEEQFYLLWPLLIVALPRRFVSAAVVATILAAPVARLAFLNWNFTQTRFQVLTVCNLDCLGLGGLLAVTGIQSSWVRRALWPGLALQLAGPLAGHTALSQVLSRTGLALVLVWLVGRAANGFEGWLGRWLESSPMLYTSRISYALYILHPAAWRASDALVAGHALWLRLPLSLLLVYSAATLSWRWLEAPFYRLRYHFPYPRAEVDPRPGRSIREPE